MAQTKVLVSVLKRTLKGRGITYAQLASQLKLSEASIKRMFSRENFTLKRLDQICQVSGIELAELSQALITEEKLISQLPPEQEKQIVVNPKLLLVAVCVLNHWSFEQIIGTYT